MPKTVELATTCQPDHLAFAWSLIALTVREQPVEVSESGTKHPDRRVWLDATVPDHLTLFADSGLTNTRVTIPAAGDGWRAVVRDSDKKLAFLADTASKLMGGPMARDQFTFRAPQSGKVRAELWQAEPGMASAHDLRHVKDHDEGPWKPDAVDKLLGKPKALESARLGISQARYLIGVARVLGKDFVDIDRTGPRAWAARIPEWSIPAGVNVDAVVAMAPAPGKTTKPETNGATVGAAV